MTMFAAFAGDGGEFDYCNTVLVSAPRTLTDKLQCVLDVAARVNFT